MVFVLSPKKMCIVKQRSKEVNSRVLDHLHARSLQLLVKSRIRRILNYMTFPLGHKSGPVSESDYQSYLVKETKFEKQKNLIIHYD